MKRFFRHILLTLFATLSVAIAWADGAVTFEVNTPLIVSTGEMFRVEFIITNGKPDSDTFVAPDFAGLDVLAGPTTSQARSYQNINGVASHTSTFTITYVVTAQNAGNLTIGSASVEVDGKSYKTKATPIEVVEQSRKQEQEAAAQQGSAVNNQIAQDDILLRLNLSRSTVYKGEPIRASLTLYTRAGIAGFEDVKLPSFNGFWSQELPTDNYQAKRETLDGKVYDSQIIKEWLLYPQQSGTLSIEPADITAVAQVVMRTNRNFDPFFGGGAEVYNVKRKLTTGQVNVAVKDLPAGAPASFNGAVGKFSMRSTMPETEIEANSADQISVTISGDGNLKFITAPQLSLPESFELYDTKIVDNIKVTAAGTSGSITYTYPFVARSAGSFTIEPLLFSYLDPSTGEYHTLSTERFSIEVSDDGSIAEAQPSIGFADYGGSMRQLDRDIRFIHTSFKPQMAAPLFVLSPLYWLIVVAFVVAFIATYVVMRRRINLNRNVVARRMKHADKYAVQRLRLAERYMREDNRHAFYEEMLRAMWGYISDKFNIPVSGLTKETIREELYRRGVSAADAEQFCEIISRADEAQYAPSTDGDMNSLYGDAVDVISKIESVVKR